MKKLDLNLERISQKCYRKRLKSWEGRKQLKRLLDSWKSSRYVFIVRVSVESSSYTYFIFFFLFIVKQRHPFSSRVSGLWSVTHALHVSNSSISPETCPGGTFVLRSTWQRPSTTFAPWAPVHHGGLLKPEIQHMEYIPGTLLRTYRNKILIPVLYHWSFVTPQIGLNRVTPNYRAHAVIVNY